ncbi:MAG: FtsQ-type POTRA domain-containing protein [Nitrospirae bacterium]|nr:FtsQ-type POTRA domain-containing protein [Nitrospirota bacterium]MCL5978363.1 FtsQ-type POTRA domain-containing protein [Nitrospirota bacterium]
MNRRNIRTLQRKKESKKIKFAVFMVILFILSGVGMYFFITNSFSVKEVVFIGNRHLKNDELKLLIKVNKEDELFGVSGRELYNRLRRSPWVRDAVIRKELSGKIVLNIAEAVPIAIFSVTGRPYLIDKDGNILEPMKEGTVMFLPVIKDIDHNRNREAYAEAVKFANVLNKRTLSYSGNIEITGQRPEDITLKLDNIAIKIGAGDFDKKLERLEFAKDEIEKRNIAVEHIDLRFADKIIVKPAGRLEEVEESGGEKKTK